MGFKTKTITQKKYYVYLYRYPDEMGGHVFYVGKGTGDRILTHEIEAAKGYRGRKCEVIRAIWGNGYQVQKQIVYETDIQQDALIYERASINTIWAGPYLTNTIGNVYRHEIARREPTRDALLPKEQKPILHIDPCIEE